MLAWVALVLVLRSTPSIEIRSSIDEGPAKPGWVYARVGQKVMMHAVTLAKAEDVVWLKLEPIELSVDNTQPSFHFAPIHYRSAELVECHGKTECLADVRPIELEEVTAAKGAGTMAFQVGATVNGKSVSTPGPEAVKYGGLTQAVHRVTFRTGDDYLGYVSELIGSPYIFGSAGPDGRNQTDLLIGADCADLAVYGRRRLGKKAEYTSSYGIDKEAPEAGKAVSLGDNGVGLDSKGRPVAVKAGDVLHFPGSRHVAVLWEDRPPLGVLDANDLMIHTCWAPPKIEPVGSTDCASLPWRVLRFK